MPGTRNIASNIRELKQADRARPASKRRSHKQIVKIAHEQARRAGAKV